MADNAIDPLRERLSAFFAVNVEAEYRRTETGAVIARPWGDPSIELRLTQDDAELIEALNSVCLPSRFVALWHCDSRDFEIIWTVLPATEERRTRAFDFRFKGGTFRCEFGESSSRLLQIAAASRPMGPVGLSHHRNLGHYYRYLTGRRDPEEANKYPTSFWIRNIAWDENAIAELVNHINFYTKYFDRGAPQIAVLQQTAVQAGGGSKVVYPHGTFPPVIAAQTLEPYLLLLWDTAKEAGDPFRQFLYNFQILEYAAFYYVQDSALHAVQRILIAPETPGRLDDAVRQILDVMTEGRLDDEAKLNAVIKQVVDPATLWKDIEVDREFFSVDAEFEGGFTVSALLKKEWDLDDFRTAWHPKFADSLRKIRNALVHAREARQARGIAPTRANLAKLRPWTRAVANAATQAIIYREL